MQGTPIYTAFLVHYFSGHQFIAFLVLLHQPMNSYHMGQQQTNLLIKSMVKTIDLYDSVFFYSFYLGIFFKNKKKLMNQI